MNRPCPISIDCPGTDSPILNISSEAPDPFVYAGVGYTPSTRWHPPRIGDGLSFPVTDCYGNSYSVQSQELAELLAAAAAFACTQPYENSGGTLGIFENTEQCASVTCSDGTVFTYCVPAGTVSSGLILASLGSQWSAMADDWALAFAKQRATATQSCVDAPANSNTRSLNTRPNRTSKLTNNPGWMCLGETLIPEENKYQVTSPNNREFHFSVSDGALAPGCQLLEVSPTAAIIIGVPTTAGIYQYKIKATSTTLPIVTAEVEDWLYVIQIQDLPGATVGTAYSEQLQVVGANSPYDFSVDPGDLPAWMSISATGLVTGTPTIADIGTVQIPVKVTDFYDMTCTQNVSITVTGVLPGPDWSQLTWNHLVRSHTPVTVVVTTDPNADIPPDPSVQQDGFSAEVDGFNFNPGDGGVALLEADLTYNGPLTHCTLDFSLARVDPDVTGSIAVKIGLTDLISPPLDLSIYPTGIHSVPFDVPDTGGSPVTIHVSITVQLNNFGAFPLSTMISAGGAFLNV